MTSISRREFIASGALAAGALSLTPAFLRDALAAPARAGASPYGPLGPPDANNLALPPGFSSREIARGLQPVAGGYRFPVFPDGQATFRTQAGGWILVTNSESLAPEAGASAIRFRPDGSVERAYRILGATNVNCAGGPTPWGTWLSGEEHDDGLIWECDPAGVLAPESRPAMGAFTHEAAAVDPFGRRIYLTEDEADGGFYRFTPASYPGLDAGRLEVATVGAGGSVGWIEVPDPSGGSAPTRSQVPAMTRFNGGEGIWYAEGVVYFTTKGDKKVWAYTPGSSTLEVLFDRAAATDSSLDAVDNVTVNGAGEVFVCEDGGNMEIGLITPDRVVAPFLRFEGPNHAGSEVAGVCFDPSGTRMYCTSQRAYPPAPGLPPLPGSPIPTNAGPGAVFEITGPFNGPPGPVYGAAGELRPNGPLNPGAGRARRPRVRVRVPRRVARATLLRRGLPVRVGVSGAALVSASLSTADLRRVPGEGTSSPRPVRVRLARGRGRLRGRGSVRLRLRLGRAARRRLARRRGALDARLLVVVRHADGERTILARTVRVGRRVIR